MPYATAQSRILLQANACSPTIATIIGLPFAERDLELIEFLKTLTSLPNPADFPTPQQIADILQVDLLAAAYTREKVLRFLHKRSINGDFTADIRAFENRPDVAALLPALRKLRIGATVFIGDSLMDIRHFSANASFPILAGSLLQSLGRGLWINAGIGGQTSAQGLARFNHDVIAQRPVRVVLSFGSNDLSNNVPLEKIVANFENMITQAKSIHADILLGLILPIITDRLWWSRAPVKNATLPERRPLLSAMLELARHHHIPCFNLLDTMTPDHYCVDGIHINQSGQELVALETLHLLTK